MELDPQLILYLLLDMKISYLYGPWKHKNPSNHEIVTQCITPSRVCDLYLMYVIFGKRYTNAHNVYPYVQSSP